MGVATKSHKIRNRQPHLVHLLLDLCVLSALPVASAAAAADVLVAVLVHLVVDIVAFIVSARLILRNNTKL